MRSDVHGRRARYAWPAALALFGACQAGPVEWQEPEILAPTAPIAAQLALAEPAYRPEGACPGSVRVAADGAARYAIWWAARPDSSAALLAARSDDGGETWSERVPVDSLDRGVSGCRRPAPAIAVDTATGYVHTAYFLEAPEGAGIFFSHSMERGALFHAPVPIVYGEVAAEVAIAAVGGTVAVAYEDPNTAGPRIGVALSRTDGHMFEHRMSAISPANMRADAPWVALRGGQLVVAWQARGRTAGPDDAPVLFLRSGTLR